MKIRPGDTIGYQGADYLVDQVFVYALAGRSFNLVRMNSPDGQIRFLEIQPRDAPDRIPVLGGIPNLDITTPPPNTIYHRGESYLLAFSGRATVTAPNADSATCTVWRYHAAGDLFLHILHIEEWPDGVRTLAGASAHAGMLEVRPATHTDPTA
jgi:hypothetical protein